MLEEPLGRVYFVPVKGTPYYGVPRKGSRIVGAFDVSQNVDFCDFSVGFGIWQGVQ